MSWVVSGGEGKSFAELALLYDASIRADLAHRAVNGLKVLRKTLMKRKRDAPMFPVVFTELLPEQAARKMPAGFSQGASISSAPQVYLDNISSEAGSALNLQWDIQAGIYPEAMIAEMFSGYCRVLSALAARPGSWHETSYAELIRARPGDYEMAGAGGEEGIG